ncbi:MAG TPA: class I SAM-dependent methyltransferase [Pyrinomonadaceae bacterium]|nr:class I SAM-dependent methyltransferase [Pyrinomonadaceae bacterium]
MVNDATEIEKAGLHRQIELLRDELANVHSELEIYRTWVPPGHVLSPIHSAAEVRERESELYAIPRVMPSIELNEENQLQLFAELLQYYPERPFTAQKTTPRRYWFENPSYSYSDAILLYCMMRHLHPHRIVEVGAGFSSAAMLDTNELFFDSGINFTIIEPDPTLFQSLLREGDLERITLLKRRVQDVTLDVFERLLANDILFIDSSHVSKVGSDVNHIFFNILPRLRSGVFIHFHDIFYPFEYPLDWVYEGRAWNEAYVLRAFLQYNQQFQIQLFNTFIDWFHKEKYFRDMPLVQKNTGGSIWLKKL